MSREERLRESKAKQSRVSEFKLIQNLREESLSFGIDELET